DAVNTTILEKEFKHLGVTKVRFRAEKSKQPAKRIHAHRQPPEIRKDWTSLFDWLDPSILPTPRPAAAFDSIDTVEEHIRVANFMGIIPSGLGDRFNRLGMPWNKKLADQVTDIV